MGRSAPPLQAIQAFLAATKTPSFRAAAEELALSPSAFSRRIQSLESFLGVALYDRSGPTPRLTEAGARYQRDLEPAIEAICTATDALRRSPENRRLRLMCPPSFAINWLMPHLRAYYDLQCAPDIDIVIGRDLDALRLGRVDLAIAIGPRDFDGLAAERLVALRGAVVAAPTLAGGRAPPRRLEELGGHRLLGLAPPDDLRHDLWRGWLASVGYNGPDLPEPTRFETWALMYEAAANGMGLTIAVPAVSESYIRDRRLIPCFGGYADFGLHYSLVFATDEVKRRADVRALSAWMMSEMTTSVSNYTELMSAAPLQ